MLNQAYLLSQLGTPRTKNWVEHLCSHLNAEGFILTDLLELTLHPEGQIAFHSAWLLDTVVAGNMNKYGYDMGLFITYAQRIKHHSCQRHYARIFMYLTGAQTSIPIQTSIARTNLEPMVELCFDWLIDRKVKVAVKACASQALYNVSGRYDWIAGELENQLDFLMQSGSPAIIATGRRLLKALRQ